MIFSVFAEIAVGPRYQDFLGQLDVQLMFERCNLILEFLLNVGHAEGTTPKVTL
jgi:hypothetical protein